MVKTIKREPAPTFMVSVVQEFLELLYWKLQQVLDREGISMLQWAFIQRAYGRKDGIPFSHIIEVTGESKDNVRRAAAALQSFASVVVDPNDRRARRLVLTTRGKRRFCVVMMRFEREVFKLLGARDERSQRSEEFKHLIWDASAYLAPGDLASEESIARSEENRENISDNSLLYVKEDHSKSVWVQDETPEEEIPF